MILERNRKRLTVVAGLVIILAGFSYLAWGGLGENLVYFVTPTELSERGDEGVDTPVRLGGMVTPGSVSWKADELDLRFQLTDGATSYDVKATGAPPQMFREGIGVVVEGSLQTDGEFHAHSLMVKHSNEYRAPAEGERPEDLYRELVGPDAG
ncbi:MAG: cytochrome c maturation protein CcmE [Gemmatimonadota bacterium]